MSNKPTYEELEQRVKQLEKESIKLKKAEEELIESEEKYRNLVERANDGVIIVQDKIVKFINTRLAKMFGYTVDRMINTPFLDYVLPDDRPRIIDIHKRRVQGEDVPDIYEMLGLHKDGRSIDIEINSGMITYREKPAVLSFVRDITDRKRSEKALRGSEKKYRHLIESINDWVWSCDTDGIHKFSNTAVKSLLGYEPQDIIGKSSFELIHPEDQDRVQNMFKEAVYRKKGWQEDAIRWFHKDKSVRFIESRAEPMLDDEGQLIGFYGIDRDITKRIHAEEALRESEDKYRHLFEMESDAIFLIRKRDGQILEVNAAGTELYGFSRKELIKMKNKDLSAEPDATQKATMEQKQRIPIRFHRRKDGNVFPVEITASHFNWQGEEVHIAAIRDITLRIEAEKENTKLEEQLRQTYKMQAIGTLTGGIAHDFNNILGIILGNTELALDDVPNWNPAKYSLEEIKTASLRAKDVIRQLLSFSRKTDKELKPLKIIPIIKESLRLLRASIPTTIDIHQNIPDDCNTIIADPTQLHQILINLSTNAAHAMQEHGGILEVSVDDVELGENDIIFDPSLSAGKYVRLMVRDTGIGIASEFKDQIFDPYFTTKEVGKGTGMGLAVVHGIIKSCNGGILIESEPGRGSTFTLYFPAVLEEPIEERESPKKLPGGNERILLVDDEESIINIGERILHRLGYQVETEKNPVDALAIFKTDPGQFDLVIVDMTMPQMTGDKLAEEFLAIRPRMPIIICTGYSEKIDEEKARKAGIRAYVMKPIEMNEIANTVRQVLDEKRTI